ncbi:Uncharacterized protein TPAR_04604 [Tolypocladium paradoxum]|uniref:Serine aminopeptidase S33 domain-containing protein n=1 Tax=Tolypocladium paradoxum TaxID=94208 RepID=A0A2S4KYC8_9HYPO|nr:Uncharacterized protein TPAR_04604 [Tolypocladium paradoxum]
MSAFDVVEHTTNASHIREFARATAESQDETLRLAVKQYVPKDNRSPRRGDLTVIGAHANGFPKELYEPMWEEFYLEAQKRGIRIRAIWTLDAAWQGRSAVLNRGKLGNDPSWNDYARDIAHVVNTFRMPRPLFAVGHSFGANALVNAALLHPRFFNGLVLLDPVIDHFNSTPAYLAKGPAGLSIYRRDVWPSRAAAAESFRRSEFYQRWDPRVLDRWIEHGLRSASGDEDGEVTLATTRHQEVFTYLRPSWPAYDAAGKTIIHPDRTPDLDDTLSERAINYPFYRAEGANTLVRLPNVRPGVLYVIGGMSRTATPELCAERTATTGTGTGGSGGVKRGRVKQVTHPDHGHLIAMEAPQYCASQAADWARTELDRWWAEEREYEEWTRRPLVEKETVGDDYKRYVGVPDRSAGRARAKI